MMKTIAEKLLSFTGCTLDVAIDGDEDWNFRTPQQRVNSAVLKINTNWLDKTHVKTWSDLYEYMVEILDMEESVANIESFLKSKC